MSDQCLCVAGTSGADRVLVVSSALVGAQTHGHLAAKSCLVADADRNHSSQRAVRPVLAADEP